MNEHPQRSLIETPTFLNYPHGFAPDISQHTQVGLIEVAQAADTPVEGDRDEVERAERGEVPFHVRQHKVTVFRRGITVEDFLSFRGAVQDILYPEDKGNQNFSA